MSAIQNSGSKADLRTKCGYPFSDKAEPVVTSSEAAKIGAYIHSIIAWQLGLAIREDPEGLDKETQAHCFRRATGAAEWARKHYPQMQAGDTECDGVWCIGGEQTFWLDMRSMMLRPEDPECVRVTPDFYAWRDLQLHVVDWKTGRHTGIDPNESLQLFLQGLVAWKQLMSVGVRIKSIVVGYGYVSDVGGVHYAKSRELHPLELQAKVSLWDEEAAAMSSEPTPGQWCKDLYCPCIDTCPAVDTLTENIVPLSALTGRAVRSNGVSLEEAFNVKDGASCAQALEILACAKTRIRDLENAIKDFAGKHGEVQLPDGKRYREVTSYRSKFNKAKAFDDFPALAGEEYHEKQKVSSWRITK